MSHLRPTRPLAAGHTTSQRSNTARSEVRVIALARQQTQGPVHLSPLSPESGAVNLLVQLRQRQVPIHRLCPLPDKRPPIVLAVVPDAAISVHGDPPLVRGAAAREAEKVIGVVEAHSVTLAPERLP